MTVVVTYVDTLRSIIMVDDRLNWGRNQEFGYEDGNIKLIDIPNMGWASGAGYSDFIDIFQQKISERNIANTTDIASAYKEAIEDEIRNSPMNKGDIESAACVASWFGMTEEGPTMRVGLLSHNHFGSELAKLENGNLQLLYPGDYLEDLSKVKVIEESYNNRFTESASYEEILETMLKIFKDISEDSIYVSENCHIGLFYIQQDGVYKSRISGEIDFLLNELANERLFNHLEVVLKL